MKELLKNKRLYLITVTYPILRGNIACGVRLPSKFVLAMQPRFKKTKLQKALDSGVSLHLESRTNWKVKRTENGLILDAVRDGLIVDGKVTSRNYGVKVEYTATIIEHLVDIN